jgi:hypothetical protein
MPGHELPTLVHLDDLKILYRPDEAAALLGISSKTLANWRCSGSPIPFRKFGRSVRYLGTDLARFMDDACRSSTSDQEDGR